MKKILLLTVITLVLSVASAFASSTINNAYSDGTLSFSVSNKVVLTVSSNTVAYTAEAKHDNGSRVFLTDNVASKIYWKDATAFDTVTSTTTAGGTTHGTPDPTGSGWTAM